MRGKGQKGCSHKHDCDCVLGEEACLKRLEGNGPTSMRECHPSKKVLNQALDVHEGRRRVADNRADLIRVRWSTHRMG